MGKRKDRSSICGFSLSFLYRLVTLFLIFLVLMTYKIMMKFDEYDARQKMIEEQRIQFNLCLSLYFFRNFQFISSDPGTDWSIHVNSFEMAMALIRVRESLVVILWQRISGTC